MFLLKYLSLFLVFGGSWSKYRIFLDPAFSPPITPPKDDDKLYSVPLNQKISRQIRAYLEKDGVQVTEENDGKIANSKFTIESIDVDVYNKKKGAVDKWKQEGGQLCQYAFNANYPMRLSKEYAKEYCGKGKTNTTLDTDLRAYDGQLIAEGLFHRHSDYTKVPANKRVFLFTVSFPNSSIIQKATHPVLVETPAWKLQFVGISRMYVANNPIKLSLNILDYNNKIVTTGLDSTAFVEVRISWEYTKLFACCNQNMMFARAEAIMGGSEVVEHGIHRDMVAKKRATAGKVVFNDIRILTTIKKIRLNATMTTPRVPWIRTPDIYNDVANMHSTVVLSGDDFEKKRLYNYTLIRPTDPAVALSRYFKVIAQRAKHLVLITPVDSMVTTIGASFHLVPDIILEVRDKNGNRIYSGRHSKKAIQVYTKPEVKLSFDQEYFYLRRGLAHFKASITQPVKDLAIYFGMEYVKCVHSKRSFQEINLKSERLKLITVTDDIYIAHFDNVHFQGGGVISGSTENSFIRYALKDIKSGVYPGILKGKNLKLKTYDTKGDAKYARKQFFKMIQDGKDTPNEQIAAMIGVESNKIFHEIERLLADENIPTISTKEDDSFNYLKLPNFFTLSWMKKLFYQSLFKAFFRRKWKHIILMKSLMIKIDKELLFQAEEAGITIVSTVNVAHLFSHHYTPGLFDYEMIEIRRKKVKIILYQIDKLDMHHVIRDAYRNQVSCMHGYQWVTFGRGVAQFPWNNEDDGCQMDPPCTIIFKGMQGFIPYYNLSGVSTDDWLRVLRHHVTSEPAMNRGKSPFTSTQFDTGIYGLAYDATIILAKAMDTLIKMDVSLTHDAIADILRRTNTEGLTGNIRFINNQRPGFKGLMVTVNPIPPEVNIPINQVQMLNRYISENEAEISLQASYPLNSAPWNYIVAPVGTPNSTYINKILIMSSTGMLSYDKFQLVSVPNDTNPPVQNYFREDVIAPFYCKLGCGGKSLFEEDITKYEFGNCSAMNTCKCNEGYSGRYCEKTSCQCFNAYKCDTYHPDVCRCFHGWSGKRCELPLCVPKCVEGQGKCASPYVCMCDTLWIGSDCSVSLPLLLSLLIIGLIILAVATFIFLRYLLRRQANKIALENLDWVVDWKDVDESTQAVSFASSIKSDTKFGEIQTVTWKHQKYFVKKFDINSLNIMKKHVRQEMVDMQELHHSNILAFAGACVEAPHVSLLVELCSKGSLEDVLANESVKLGWDFRFSILKDICRGMNFLHHSVIGSHGRLKSSNCLIDNRWTCKISGYGCPTMRFNSNKLHTQDFYSSGTKPSSMFWTAPELLKTNSTLDEVRSGTKAGDVYSFAIIFSEVITREEPFATELCVLEPKDILRLLRYKDSPESKEGRQALITLDIDFTQGLRPYVDVTLLPRGKKIQFRMMKLLHLAWHENPVKRPTYKNMLNELVEIYPIKGHLIDNLLVMLEKYSQNLEIIVADRSQELMAEKQKTELLASQMLPKKVVADLKYGRKVHPETFSCVTIFFSDIVGFTYIAKESTPLQVVELLNDLYTTFDEIIDNYDVYKVETIGDAYMVVSGLPIRNGDLHAGEIATMSLDLVYCLNTFKIKHMPHIQLQLRVGMHSGSCVAGVVGLKMPRYCLFGETVNTASCVESSGMAQRIHISNASVEILQKLGGYHFEDRGPTKMKRNLVMITYWLVGKDDFKTLPDTNEDNVVSRPESHKS